MEINKAEAVQPKEAGLRDVGDVVVVDVDVGDVCQQAARLEDLEVVEAGVEGVQVVAGLQSGKIERDYCYVL